MISLVAHINGLPPVRMTRQLAVFHIGVCIFACVCSLPIAANCEEVQTRVTRLLAQAVSLYRKGEYDQSRSLLEIESQHYPTDWRVWMYLGDVDSKLGDWVKRDADYLAGYAAAKLDNNNVWIGWTDLGDEATKGSECAIALEAYSRALEHTNNRSESRIVAGRMKILAASPGCLGVESINLRALIEEGERLNDQENVNFLLERAIPVLKQQRDPYWRVCEQALRSKNSDKIWKAVHGSTDIFRKRLDSVEMIF